MNILQKVIKNSGITLNNDMTEKTSLKYISSIKGNEIKKDLKTITFQEFLTTMNEIQKSAKKENVLIGLWIDNGYLYIDISKEFTNKKECINFGKQNNQLAIFDGIKKEVIKI